MWSNWAESAKSSVTQALEKTGDALSKAATNAGKSARSNSAHDNDNNQKAKTVSAERIHDYNEPTFAELPPALSEDVPVQKDSTATTNENQLLSSLTHGWLNVLETTRASMRHAEEAINEQRAMFQQTVISKAMSSKPCIRDPSLPLDVEALQDAEVVYVTDRILTMGHPAMDSQVNSDITGTRKLSAVAHLLARRHSGRFMIWNLSEVDYDVGLFDDQVLTYSFPGSPSPPLGLLLKLFISLESWLKADSRNVAVLHCLTGKGRTSTVLAAFLCWMGEAQFSDIYQALEYIATCKHVSVEDLTIPSQRRYASYFKNMLDGIRPSQPPLMLKRIIMSEAPRFAKGPPRPNDTKNQSSEKAGTEIDGAQLLGCVPYIQVFKAGKLLHTAPASLHFQQAENELPFCRVSDGNISFNVNLVIQGDILVRARHLTPSKKRVSMFRAAFHTGYAPANVMRFTKSQLDGACTDDRFDQDFFLDLLLEPVSAEEASKILQSQDTVKETSHDEFESGAKSPQASSVQASAEDSMLYGDSRFWDVIKNRMKENATTTASKTDPLWGPTVGRRRDSKNSQNDLVAPATDSFEAVEQQKKGGDMLGTFSIGGELDFLPVVIGSETSQTSPNDAPKVAPPMPNKPQKDTLLEALMGALDDVDAHDELNDDNEEVIEFENHPEGSSVSSDLNIPPNKTAIEKESPIDLNPSLTAATMADDITALLSDAQERADDDWDALLSTQANAMTDDDLLNLEIDEIDDAELTDLESFLSK